MANDIIKFCKALTATYPWYVHLDDVRKIALLDMAFNLGMEGLAEFKNMLMAIEHGAYQKASCHALNSKWADQVGKRAEDVAHMIETGDLPT